MLKSNRHALGFSLVELLVAFGIFVIIVSIAILMFSGLAQSQKEKADVITATSIQKALSCYIYESGDISLVKLNVAAATGICDSEPDPNATIDYNNIMLGLQKRLKYTTPNETEYFLGPYLSPKGTPSSENYIPLSKKYSGFRLTVFTSNNQVKVTPLTSEPSSVVIE